VLMTKKAYMDYEKDVLASMTDTERYLYGDDMIGIHDEDENYVHIRSNADGTNTVFIVPKEDDQVEDTDPYVYLRVNDDLRKQLMSFDVDFDNDYRDKFDEKESTKLEPTVGYLIISHESLISGAQFVPDHALKKMRKKTTLAKLDDRTRESDETRLLKLEMQVKELMKVAVESKIISNPSLKKVEGDVLKVANGRGEIIGHAIFICNQLVFPKHFVDENEGQELSIINNAGLKVTFDNKKVQGSISGGEDDLLRFGVSISGAKGFNINSIAVPKVGMKCWIEDSVNGAHSYGTITKVDKETVTYDVSTTGGTCGSPVYVDGGIVAIHTYGQQVSNAGIKLAKEFFRQKPADVQHKSSAGVKSR